MLLCVSVLALEDSREAKIITVYDRILDSVQYHKIPCVKRDASGRIPTVTRTSSSQLFKDDAVRLCISQFAKTQHGTQCHQTQGFHRLSPAPR